MPLIALVIAACSAALLLPLLYPLLTGRVFVFNDFSWFHLPMRYLYRQALHSGDTVLWTPSIFAGMYIHGEGQVGLFHPFHQLLYRLFPLGPALNLELIASYPAAFAGMFWLLRRLRCSHAAALFGAMVFAFGGFNLLHHHHMNMVAVVAHMPWLLAAADVLIADERRRSQTLAVAGMAAILGSELLLGFPQAVWWNVLTLAAFGLFRAVETRRWRQLLPCAAAVALGVMLGGIQLLPSLDLAAHSTRAELSREFALTYSLHPYNIVQFWSPYFFKRGAYSTIGAMQVHEYGLYSGAIMPIAFIWVWIRRGALRPRRALIAAATIFAVVTLILALGQYGGLAVLLTYVPIIQSLRAPARYIVLVQFALAIVAAVALDDLLAIADGRTAAPSKPPWPLWIPAALCVATTLVLNSGVLHYEPRTFATMASASRGVAIFVIVTLCFHLAARRARWAIAALVVATAVDLAVWGLLFIYREPPRTIVQLTRSIPPAPDNPAAAYAAATDVGFYRSDLIVMRGYRLTSGYVGLYPAAEHPLDSDIAMRLSGTRWFFSPDGTRHSVQGSVERVRLLDEHGNPATGTARLAVDRPGRLVAHVDAPGRRVLAFTERFYDGWSATMGGRPLEMVRVADDFLGCAIDSGTQRVTLTFMPRSFVLGSIVSAVGAALVLGLLLTVFMDPRRA